MPHFQRVRAAAPSLDPAAPGPVYGAGWPPAPPTCCAFRSITRSRPAAKSADGDLFRVDEKLGVEAGRQVFVSKSLTNSIGAEFGLAIFSRLPIVGRGEIAFGRLSQNHAMWVDVAGPGPHDTVRVFNAHLQSMSLDERDIVTAGSSRAGLQQARVGACCGRFVRGAAARAWQADTLLAHICPLALPRAAGRRPQRPALFLRLQRAGRPAPKRLGHSGFRAGQHLPRPPTPPAAHRPAVCRPALAGAGLPHPRRNSVFRPLPGGGAFSR
ncbi:MAG: hypothetical protein WKG07_03515 [Hymenobacter sp.]